MLDGALFFVKSVRYRFGQGGLPELFLYVDENIR